MFQSSDISACKNTNFDRPQASFSHPSTAGPAAIKFKNTSNLILTLAAMLVAFQFLFCVLANCPQQFDRVNGSLVYCALFQQGPQLLVSSAMFVGFKGVYTVE